MKKFKIIFATVMLGIATVGGFQAYEYANITQTETLLLENVEALASGETNEEFYEKTGCDSIWEDRSCSGKDGKSYSYAERR